MRKRCPLSRRTFLAGATALAATMAGCGGTADSSDETEASDTLIIIERATHTVSETPATGTETRTKTKTETGTRTETPTSTRTKTPTETDRPTSEGGGGGSNGGGGGGGSGDGSDPTDTPTESPIPTTATETPTSSDLVIESDGQHTTEADESYVALEWYDRGRLILEHGAVLELRDSSA